MHKYIVKSTHDINEVFGTIRRGKQRFNKASVMNMRIQNFYHHGVRCVGCGIRGEYFKIERQPIEHKYGRWHLNLYAKTGDKEIQITTDHIIPKSRGGKTVLNNLQPMCWPCNLRKGNRLPGEKRKPRGEEKRKKRERLRKLGYDKHGRAKVVDWRRVFTRRCFRKTMRAIFVWRMRPIPPFKKVHWKRRRWYHFSVNTSRPKPKARAK